MARSGAATFAKALVPGYGNFAAPNWPGTSLGGKNLSPFNNQVSQGASVHDSAYGQLQPGQSQTPADRALISNVWNGPGIQPGPVGQVYRVLLTGGFYGKIGFQTALGN